MTKSDTILTNAGSYFLGNDGRGTITINTGDTDIGGNGIETFTFVYLTNSQSLISQLDLGNAQTGSSAVGTMDLQTEHHPSARWILIRHERPRYSESNSVGIRRRFQY